MPTILTFHGKPSKVWVGTSDRYLDMLGKLLKRLCRVVSPILTTSLGSQTHLHDGTSSKVL